MFRKTINPTEFAVKLKICLTAIDERGIKLLKATFWFQIVVNSNIEKSRDLIYFSFYCYNDIKMNAIVPVHSWLVELVQFMTAKSGLHT